MMHPTTMLTGITLADLSPFANHLWQSTLCAAAVWLLTLVFKKNHAAVRYWLWLAASAKFLVPCSLLVSLGSQVAWRTAPAAVVAQLHWSSTIADVGSPFSVSPQALRTVVEPPSSALPSILFAIWVLGFAASLIFWLRSWRQMRAGRRAATPLPLGLPIPVMSSPTLMEPGVFGIRMPVLLLPEGIADRLTPEQLNAVLAHEMCHVRRRDNLTAAFHMVVEAVFWFYPLVWWIRARLVEEREQACDEAVLQSGSDAEAYAESILNVCKFYIESPIACVSGISGSDLKKRIVRIMAQRAAGRLSASRKVLLAAVAIAAVVGPVTFGIANAPAIPAQLAFASMGGTTIPSFEVASVRPDRSGQGFNSRISAGRLVMERWRVKDMIEYSYAIEESQVLGVPKWIDSERYDIEAKVEDSVVAREQNMTAEQRKSLMRLRVQDLLANRFGLRVHHSVENLPVLALVVARNGPKFFEAKVLSRPAADTDGRQVNLKMDGKQWILNFDNAPLSSLVLVLSGQAEIEGRVVVDKTGLTGNYAFTLQWAPQYLTGPPFTQEPSGATLFTSLREQLGLKLESQKAMAEVLVIDHIEQPSAN